MRTDLLVLSVSLGLLAACSSGDTGSGKAIEGFGHVKLGQYLPDAKAALDAQGIYHSYTGQALIYETTANDERWYVAAGIVQNHVANIAVSARKIVVGAPPPIIGTPECDRRFDRTVAALRHEYGDEAPVPHGDAADLDDMAWSKGDRSVTFTRHKVEGGCDTFTVTYEDHGIADHF